MDKQPTVAIGTRFPAYFADSVLLWEVVEKRDGDLWRAVIVDEEHKGTERFYSTEQILNALENDTLMGRNVADTRAFWENVEPGSTLHVYGSGGYYRGIVVDEGGVRKFQPESLVGAWARSDLPRRLRDGRIEHGYAARQILKGQAWQANISAIWEAWMRRFDADPRGLPEIDLAVPPMTPEEEARARRVRLLTEIQDALDMDAPEEERLGKIQEIARRI